MKFDLIQFFDGTYTPRSVEITTVSVDWGYKWTDNFADLIEQYKEKCSKENTKESYITLKFLIYSRLTFHHQISLLFF
jgi:hypothetical protein